MCEGLQFGAFKGKLEHALAAEVINLEGIEERIIEAYARRTIDDQVYLLGEQGAISDAQPQLVNDEVTGNWDDPLV